MRLRSFHGANLTEAMRLVRDALGDNAIIVATHDNDTTGVRVTAAIDDTPVVEVSSSSTQTAVAANNSGSEVIEVIAKALLRHQVPTSLAEKLLASATQFANDDPVISLAAAFETHFQFDPLPEDNFNKPLVFVGMPGAGKTLCTAKIATKSTLSKKQVTVISMDIERAGGMEQLAAFTRLLKTGLMEIEDYHALKDAIGIQPKGACVIVDTPGRNPFKSSEKQQLQSIISAGGGDGVLVMPADLEACGAIEMANEFKAAGASRLLFTRLDMTRRFGSMLRAAFESKLPLSNYSNTHKVTEPPMPFNSVILARIVLNGMEDTQTQQIQATGTDNR